VRRAEREGEDRQKQRDEGAIARALRGDSSRIVEIFKVHTGDGGTRKDSRDYEEELSRQRTPSSPFGKRTLRTSENSSRSCLDPARTCLQAHAHPSLCESCVRLSTPFIGGQVKICGKG
jgi:hypothetical protein